MLPISQPIPTAEVVPPSARTSRPDVTGEINPSSLPLIMKKAGPRASIDPERSALRANRPTLVDHLLSGPTWDQELVDAVSQREKTPGRDIAF